MAGKSSVVVNGEQRPTLAERLHAGRRRGAQDVRLSPAHLSVVLLQRGRSADAGLATP